MRSAMFTAMLLASVAAVACAYAESSDYLASKTYELGLAGEYYTPNDTVVKGGDCAVGEVYDDGSFETYYSKGGSKAGFVQLFKPRQLPYRYDTVCVCIKRSTSSGSQISAEIVFYDDDGPDGSPGTLLGSVSRIVSGITDQVQCSFVSIDLNDDAPLITDGSVYVGLLYNANTNIGIHIGADTSETTIAQPIYSTFNGVDFEETAGSIFNDARAMAIRASGQSSCTEVVPGSLSIGSGHWDRVFYTALPNLNCEAVPTDSTNDIMAYEVIPIASPTGGLFTAEITTTIPAIDTVMLLYCDPFDPDNPTANLIFYDDDDGPGSLSAFDSDDGLELMPNTIYNVVVSSYNSASYGAYTLCLGNGYTRQTICTETIEGTLSASSPHYDRIIANTSSSGCNALTADTVQDNMPYTAILFEMDTAAYLEVSVNDLGTSITDPVMTLYCDPFDPAMPGVNVKAYDDNDGSGMMPAFTAADQILLETNNRYWLVLSTWTGNDGDGGDFELCFANDVSVAYPIAECSDDTIFGNKPVNPLDIWNAQNVGDAATRRYYDDFSGLSEPIRSVTWYGFIAEPANPPPVLECSPGPTLFDIEFFADAGGTVGTSIYAETLRPAIVPTGIQYRDGPQFELLRFSAGISEDVFLNTGWLSVTAHQEDACTSYWIYSVLGNGGAAVSDLDGSNQVAFGNDFAFCLSSEDITQHSADTDLDYVLNLSELLRVIQFFNSDGYHCDALGEDGFAPGSGSETCSQHSADYSPADWEINLSELLRVIQFYNSGGYHPCAEGEDGFCPGL